MKKQRRTRAHYCCNYPILLDNSQPPSFSSHPVQTPAGCYPQPEVSSEHSPFSGKYYTHSTTNYAGTSAASYCSTLPGRWILARILTREDYDGLRYYNRSKEYLYASIH